MKNLQLIFLLFFASCAFQEPEQSEKQSEIERIVRTLSADDMQGRAPFTPGIDKAASFIEKEFKEIGLKPMEGDGSYLQRFSIKQFKAGNQEIIINGKMIVKDSVIVITDLPKITYSHKSDIEVISIKPNQNLIKRYQDIIQLKKPVLVLVDETYSDAFNNLRNKSINGRLVEPEKEQSGAAIFVLGIKKVHTFKIDFSNQIENLPLFNVIGILPGKKAKELVIFSAHYDHLGIIKPMPLIYNLMRLRVQHLSGDSIANGADDDATGVAAVISLAKHYKNLDNNERTLIFVAFTAEEIGNYGSRHFSKTLNPSEIIAMFNIEMIGKHSKFGEKSAFITGYDVSDFGEILQRNLIGSDFEFHPDPYPEQNLFYRSDNASLAALGIPAHTISTDQIDGDKYYHTVKDEFNTIDLTNIATTIDAIALSSRSIVAGTDTPRRIPVAPLRAFRLIE